MLNARSLGLAAALLAFALPRAASAYENQLAVGLDVAGAHAVGGDGYGIGAGPHAKIGLDDTWNLYAAGLYSFHPASGDTLHLATLAAGIEYVVDVLRWIPYGGIGVVGALVPGEDGRQLGVGGQLAFGVDYLISRNNSVGIVGRYALFLVEPSRVDGLWTLALRGSLLWDL